MTGWSRGVAVLTVLAALVAAAAAAAADEHARVVRSTDGRVQLRINEPTLCAPDVQQYAGYIDIDDEKHYFFWFFESRNSPATDPIISFHNGGPGCSSMVGLLAEKIGPCEIADDLTEIPNEYTWIRNASLISIDAPVGAGFSYSDGNLTTINSKQYADDLWAFFNLFFDTFPKYRSLPLHVFGESYAGHYVPALASRIVEGNNAGESDINLQSIAVGNALVDALYQYPSYPRMACNNSYGIKVFEQDVCDFMESRMPPCIERIEKCYAEDAWAPCVWSGLSCNLVQISLVKFDRLTDRNPYDIRIPCEVGNLCYDFSSLERYLRDDDVKAQLGVNKYWRSCNYRINLLFQLVGADWMRPYGDLVPPLLDEAGVRVLVYSGDADYIVNWYGSLDATVAMQWSGGDAFRRTTMTPWIVNGQEAGEFRTYGPLSFLRAYEAGHMFPMDQPDRALQMVQAWVNNEPFPTRSS